MPGGVVDKAKELRERLRETERMDVVEVQEWLKSEGIDNQHSGLIVGYGMGRQRHWWRKEKGENGEELVYQAPAIKPPEPLPIDPPQSFDDDVTPMTDPAMRFAAMAVQLGVKESIARTVAFYCFGSFDMDKPEQAWAALAECVDLSKVNRRRLWRTWLTSLGIQPDATLVRQVEEATTEALGQRSGVAQNAAVVTAQRRFIAVNGEVHLAESGDEGGLSFTEALRVAQLQIEKSRVLAPPATPPAPQQDNTFMSSAFSTLGSITAEAVKRPPDTSRDELIRVEMQQAKADNEHRQERLMDEIRHQREMDELHRREESERFMRLMEKQTELIQAMGQSRSPWEDIDRTVPGLSQRIMDMVLNPPKPQQPSFPFDMGNGQAIPMTMEGLGQWMTIQEKVEDIRNKREALGIVRENAPKIAEAAQAWAAALNRAAAEEQESGDVQDDAARDEVVQGQETALSTAQCVNCEGKVSYYPREGLTGFYCPFCNVGQTFDGQVVAKPEDSEEVPSHDERTEATAGTLPSPASLPASAAGVPIVSGTLEEFMAVTEVAAPPAPNPAEAVSEARDREMVPA